MVVTVPLFFGVGVLPCSALLLARLRPVTLTMMSVLLTFAIALIIEGLLGYVFTGTQRRIQLGYGSASIGLFGARIAVVKLIAFGLAAVALLALYLLMKKTTFGWALRATIQHRDAARLVGIDTDRVAGYGFGLGLATAAVGGTALSLDTTIYPSLHWHWIGPLMAIIVVGGLGSVPGAAIAAMRARPAAEPAADPDRHDLGADRLLPRAVRHAGVPAAGILRRSACPAILSPRSTGSAVGIGPARRCLVAGGGGAVVPRRWRPTRTSCRPASSC